MHILLRPPESGANPGLCQSLSDAIDSIGDLEVLRQRGKKRVQDLQDRGYSDARIYNLPPAPEVPTAYLKSAWTSAFISAVIIFAIVCAAFAF